MNLIEQLLCDDFENLKQIAANKKLKSFPALSGIVAAVSQSYNHYISLRGDALQIPVAQIVDGALAEEMQKHYKSPPAALSFIAQYRNKSDCLCCPMCGSFAVGTLDHIFPKASYPHFSFFSKNLVPACKCNSLRGTKLLGTQPGQRILHPYFDGCLSKRLVIASFEDLGDVPKIGLKICLGEDDPYFPAVHYHIENVVAQTTILRHISRLWSKLLLRPATVLPTMTLPKQSLANLGKGIEVELARLDDYYESKNNWSSVFLAGLLDAQVLSWLHSRLYGADPSS